MYSIGDTRIELPMAYFQQNGLCRLIVTFKIHVMKLKTRLIRQNKIFSYKSLNLGMQYVHYIVYLVILLNH